MNPLEVKNPYGDSFFSVPKTVLNHLKSASNDDLRLLLLILSKKGEAVLSSEELMAAGLTYENALGSLKKWRELGVFPQDSEDTSSIPSYSPSEIANKLSNDSELRNFIKMAEMLLSKTLSPAEISSLYGICDYLGMSPDTVIILIEFCASEGKRGIKYIEKTAVAWARDGIITHDSAMERIKRMQTGKSFEEHLSRLFGLNRSLSPSELKYASKWAELNLSDDDFLEAFDKTVQNTGKASFAYMNTILTSPKKEAGAKPAKPPSHSSKRIQLTDFDQRSYEYMKSLQSKKGAK